MIERRLFLKGSALSLLAPGVMETALAAEGAAVIDRFFFDERFEEARALAGRTLRARVAIPVRGDVTPVWSAGLKRASQQAPLMLAGVTTESFHFCIKTLMASHARVETEIQRVGRDLYAWRIETRPAQKG